MMMPTPTHLWRILLLLLCIGTTPPLHAQTGEALWLKNINAQRSYEGDVVMATISTSVYPISAAVPMVQLAYGYKQHDAAAIRRGWVAVAGLGVDVALTFGVKYAVNRPRPYITYPIISPYQTVTDPSFPSGHTSVAFTTATMLTLQFPRWYVATPAYLWAASVGYSRMYLGMHYPSDVAIGAVIGAGSAWLCYKGNKWLQGRK